MKIALIQKSRTSDIENNIQTLKESIKEAAINGAELVVLQELHNSLYFCQVESTDNFDLAESIPGPSTEFFGNVAKECGVVLVTSLFERRAAGLYHNTAVVFDKDGSIAGKYRGARLMALQGAELLIYPTAIGWESTDTEEEKQRQLTAWQTVQRGHAVANGIPVVAVNRSGHEVDPSGQTNGIDFWGHSFVAGPQGEMLAEAGIEPTTLIVDVDMKRSENVRRWWPFLRDRRIEEFGELSRRFID